MGRPKSDNPADQKVQAHLTGAELARVDDWMVANHIRSRSEAVRQLIERGLDALVVAIDQPGDWRRVVSASGRVGFHQGISAFPSDTFIDPAIFRGPPLVEAPAPEPEKPEKKKRTRKVA